MPFGLSDAQLHAVMLALAPLDPSKRAESPTLRAASWSKFPPLLSEEEWAEKYGGSSIPVIDLKQIRQ